MIEGYDVVRGYGLDKRFALFDAELHLPLELGVKNYESIYIQQREFRPEGLSADTFWEVTILYRLRSAENTPGAREIIQERQIQF